MPKMKTTVAEVVGPELAESCAPSLRYESSGHTLYVSLSSSKSVFIRRFFLASFPQENRPTFFHLPLLAVGPWRYCGQMKEDVSA